MKIDRFASRHPRAFAALAAALVASALASCNESASANSAPPQAPPPFEVTVARVEPREIPWAPVHLAQTAASRDVEIRARVAGLLTERTFTEGSFVHTGDVLYHIDPRPFQAALEAAKATLAESQARVAEAERTVGRKETLVASEAVAQRELDDARTDLALAKAQTAKSEAQLDQAKLDLEFTTVTAPFDGRVGKVIRDAGSTVDTMMNPLMTTMTRLDPIYVSFRVSERELLAAERARKSGEIAPVGGGAEDLRVAIELIDGTPYAHEGKINYRSVQVDPATGTAEVRAELPNPDEAVLPGQFVRARVLGLARLNVLTVPQRAVMMGQTTSYVYVVGDGDKVESRQVVLSSWEGDEWIVEEGLKAGERVVVDGVQKVRPGAVVKPVEKAEKPQQSEPAAAQKSATPQK